MNGEGPWKEPFMPYFSVRSQNSPKGTEEKHKFPAEIGKRNPQNTETNHTTLDGPAFVVSAEFHGMLDHSKFVVHFRRSNLV
jgi:hypothetical protein